MPGSTDMAGPFYISSHSADVILSEIRPIKLKIEALRSINVLLDEFLYGILSTACSLSTDKLRASLLSLLPTSLGKEALLEAEVELRAYWDRTGPVDATIAPLEDESKIFHLQWAFELLRLKCEAYSTLNESDEDHAAEGRINDRMSAAGGSPPNPTLVAPAALYLTAILEAMCEHILSNVGRVASRDSSRTTATIQDLFVALCEDHAIYGLFKTMKVYEQIEQLSKAPKVRRSKSLTRNERSSRTSSPHQDQSTVKDGTSARSRLSSEASAAAGPTPISNAGSRSSYDKTRAMKMFIANSRSSIDRDGENLNGHKKSDSFLSEHSRHVATPSNDGVSAIFENEAMQQDFDNLMRSSSTMKVSLTPDRLKTMEVYKQERDQRSNRRIVPLSLKSDSDSSVPTPRATGRRPSLLRVDSIKEDDEEPSPNPPSVRVTRNRQASVSSAPTSAPSPSRIRSVSTSGANAIPRALTKLSRTNTPPVAVPTASASASMQYDRRMGKGQDPFPPRTRQIQHNRESLDLDDIMAGSDDENPSAVAQKPANITTPSQKSSHGVSASTRDLMDFLAEGPPDLGGPLEESHHHNGSVDHGRSKGSGRLQRMISKLSLGGAERSREDSSRSKIPNTPIRETIPSKVSYGNLSSLANRPIPPRPPRPASPPASLPQDSSDEQIFSGSRFRAASLVQSPPRRGDIQPVEPPPPIPNQKHKDNGSVSHRYQPQSPVKGSRYSNRSDSVEVSTTSPVRNINTAVRSDNFSLHSPVERPKNSPQNRIEPSSPTPPTATQSRSVQSQTAKDLSTQSPKPPLVYAETIPKPHLSGTEAQNLRRLFSKATTADECRLIYDMFLAKSGIATEPTNYDIPYPSPSPSLATRAQVIPADVALERSLVEVLLGGNSIVEPVARRRRARKQPKPEPVVEQLASSNERERKTSNGDPRVRNDLQYSSNGRVDDPTVLSSPSKPSPFYTPVTS